MFLREAISVCRGQLFKHEHSRHLKQLITDVISARVHRQKGLCRQARDRLEAHASIYIEACHGFGSINCERFAEDSQTSENSLLLPREHAVAPFKSRIQRLMPGLRRTSTVGKNERTSDG